MSPRSLVLFVACLGLSTTGFQCAPHEDLQIAEPDHRVESFVFDVVIEFGEDVLPETLVVEINGVEVTDRLAVDAGGASGSIAPGAPLRDWNQLEVRVQRAGDDGGHWSPPGWLGKLLALFGPPPGAGHEELVRHRLFRYAPPGKALARRIARQKDRIRGPLGHSRIGDYLLANGEARFAIQDAGQRELYSVGQFGGNLIDAELVSDPGHDNFLELQPSLNIESVVNAQTVEVVNDGQDGTAAQIRSCGPDDLLDFVNPSSQVNDLGIGGIRFPASADDKDLEIEACTTFTLEPGDRHVRIDTEVFNNQIAGMIPPGLTADLPLVVGDWFNPAGELDTFARAVNAPAGFDLAANGVGPATTSNLGTLSFYGFDEAAGVDYAFSQVPLEGGSANGSFVFISGVLVVLHSQNVLTTLIGFDPVRFVVPLGGSLSYTRYFGVGDGSASNAVELENEVRGYVSGELSGCVSVAGAPVAGARVSVGNPFATGRPAGGPADRLAGHFTTRPGACPNYSGRLREGSYFAAAALDGHLYEGGASAPPVHAVTIAAASAASLDIDLPATGRLRVHVSDENDAPLPARVTVVGFDPSAEPTSPGPTLPGFGGGPLGLFNDVSDRLPYGVAAVGYADASGVAELDLEPGSGLYHVFVSRGSEYSAWRTPLPLDVAAGTQTIVHARIARVVDTTGFISSDFHVHGIRSADSRVSDVHRVESYSAEGVENVIMTDHHVHTDLRPTIQLAGMSEFVTATIGEEITTFDYGHFNAYPLLLDPDSPHATRSADGMTQLSGGSTDWALPAPPGQDFPIYGALNATPAEIYDLATAGPLSRPGVTTIQVNHIGSHFSPLKIDTSLVPPADLMSDADRAGRRLPDTATVPNLFHPFPALELWNGDGRSHQGEFLNERIGIWFNLLRQGLRTTFIADTDSHTFTNLNSAGARTWTASPTDRPDEIDPGQVAASVDAGRAIGGQGVFVTSRLLATDGSGQVASLAWSGDVEMSDSNGDVVLEISVQSPSWAEWDTIEVYANAASTPTTSPYQFGAQPSLTLFEGDCDPSSVGDGDFDLTRTPDVGGVAGADRLSAVVNVPFNGLTEETFFVVVVKGSTSRCRSMYPVYPDGLSSANTTLADLVDANVGDGVPALGATNALYFVP